MGESRSKVTVSPSPREAATGWLLDAVFANGKQAAIAGFRTEAEAHEWLGSVRHVLWLRDIRTGLYGRPGIAIFEWLEHYGVVLAAVACGLIASAIQRFDTAVRRATCGICAWRRAAGLPGSIFWRRHVYRRRLVATGALLVLIVTLVTLGRSEQPARSDVVAGQIGAGPQRAHAPSVEEREIVDPIALLIDRLSSSSEVATEPLPEAATDVSPPPTEHAGLDGEIQAATPRDDLRRAPPAIVGVWAPEPSSCSTRNAREGTLQAVIGKHGARAGTTSCIFRNQRQTERDWRVLADCANGHDRWIAHVSLTVKGDRLIWTSERGTQAYARCRSSA